MRGRMVCLGHLRRLQRVCCCAGRRAGASHAQVARTTPTIHPPHIIECLRDYSAARQSDSVLCVCVFVCVRVCMRVCMYVRVRVCMRVLNSTRGASTRHVFAVAKGNSTRPCVVVVRRC